MPTMSQVAAAADPAVRLSELRDKIKPMLKEHCFDCHSGAEPDAGLTLTHFDSPLAFLKGRSLWEKAILKMQLGEMPPPESSSLTETDRKGLIDWIKTTIDEYECGLEPNPGKVTLRRLNASEYKNTIRDLFSLKAYEPASSFPGDDVGYGFDNIGDVLTLPPMLMEKYFLEAERISKTLIQTPPPAKVFTATYAGRQLEVEGQENGSERELTLAANGIATFREQVPWAGAYRMTIQASGDQAGDEACAMGVAVDGKMVRKISVGNDRDEPAEFVVPLRLRAGRREIAIGFLNDFYIEQRGNTPAQDRNLVIHHVRLNGKKTTGAKQSASQLSKYHKAIIFATPSSDDQIPSVTRAVIERLASRAFRRPVTRSDLDRLVALAASVQDQGDSFEESIQVVLQAILISPKFLFRVEPPSAGLSFTKYRDLDDFELATRLSYFLWSSMPDDELLKLAWQKRLRTNGNIGKQIARMIQDTRANDFVRNFAGQWLTLRKLRDLQPSKEQFPRWNDRIKALTEYETMTFFAGVMRRDMSVLRLLDADFTYLNEELAEFYEIPGVSGAEFRAVSLKGTPRAGLLTQASILAVTSNPTRTSPVKRGKWILDNLLATPPPPPPVGVPDLEEKAELVGTMQEQLAQHRADPACASCHTLMDPLGFALENFDAVGRYRTSNGRVPIDATGELPDGSTVSGATELQQVLIESYKDKFVECLTEKMLTYALGRGLEYYDKCAVDKIVSALEKNDYRFSTLLVEIVQSDPFQKKGEREIE